jgi:ABC-type dipeptide/oligopeptide/nickel transport system ATPase component
VTGVDVTAATQPLLSVRGLVTEFMTDEGVLRAVDDVSFDLDRGETLAIVGESGSGKSVTALSILQLLPSRKAKIAAGEILFDGVDLRRQSTKALRTLRGKAITMVFQDAMAYLNPTLPVGRQLGEAIRTHDRSISKRGAEARAAELLELVGITRSRERLREYPHEFSGGMLQRVMIAMAIANGPRLLIADEPTTALDVTIQAQIVEILKRVQEETGTSLILITHDIGLAADMVDRVVVMYAGRVVETGRI